ncbi:MAG TPA: DUF3817 domain-containing protein, partial [Polyangiaceae bacterium]|nr:DUF3817 domain-containing protein [Polyangiaceae bacterium]
MSPEPTAPAPLAGDPAPAPLGPAALGPAALGPAALGPAALGPDRRLRRLAFAEGASLLVLLGVAMPLKYAAGLPAAVRVTGLAHGLLFVFYVVAVLEAFGTRRLSGRTAALAIAAAMV